MQKPADARGDATPPPRASFRYARAAQSFSGNVLVPLCPPGCTSPNHGTWTLTAGAVKTLKAGRTYVNVHTVKNPLGEIRGQITETR